MDKEIGNSLACQDGEVRFLSIVGKRGRTLLDVASRRTYLPIPMIRLGWKGVFFSSFIFPLANPSHDGNVMAAGALVLPSILISALCLACIEMGSPFGLGRFGRIFHGEKGSFTIERINL
jgi:hypothetical protein